MAHLVIFDCDGTLVDSQQVIVRAVQDALQQCGQSLPTRAQVLQNFGLPMDIAIQQYVPSADTQLRARIAKAWVDASARLDRQMDKGQVMFAGMRDVLRYIAQRQGFKLGVITMKSRKGLNRVLKVYKLTSYFDVTKTADDGPSKPSPVLLEQAMMECAVTPQDTVMVGDTVYDIQMAKAAGAYAIGVSWGYQHVSELKQAGADDIADMPVNLLDLIRHTPWRGR